MTLPTRWAAPVPQSKQFRGARGRHGRPPRAPGGRIGVSQTRRRERTCEIKLLGDPGVSESLPSAGQPPEGGFTAVRTGAATKEAGTGTGIATRTGTESAMGTKGRPLCASSAVTLRQTASSARFIACCSTPSGKRSRSRILGGSGSSCQQIGCSSLLSQ